MWEESKDTRGRSQRTGDGENVGGVSTGEEENVGGVSTGEEENVGGARGQVWEGMWEDPTDRTMALEGKVALVTGGAQGIGRAVVQTLVQNQAQIPVIVVFLWFVLSSVVDILVSDLNVVPRSLH
uniref:Uncharacterized protein n=1 Tax=Knipowitschia caucasica TaxID=637954 RepID=A0AAV2LQ63_KNICA